MRLIDADELKRAIEKELSQMSNWGETFIPLLIDNAPTINPLTDPLFDAYSKIADLEFEHSGDFWITTPKGKKIYFEKKRPRGKWISQFDYSQQHKTMPSGYGNFWWCNKCDSSTEKKSNFCPNCGADMRKGDES